MLLLCLALSALAAPTTHHSPGGKHTLVIDGESYAVDGVAKGKTPAHTELHVLDSGAGAGAVFRDGPVFVVAGGRTATIEGAGPWWVDETRGRIVVVCADGIRELDLDAKSVKGDSNAAILGGLRLAHARDRAFEAGLGMQLQGVEDLVADAALPVATRLRAALIMEGARGPEAPLALFEEAVAGGDDAFALRHAARLQHFDFLEEVARRKGWDRKAIAALAHGGPDAAAVVVSILLDEHTSAEGRREAIPVLRALDASAVFNAVTPEIDDADAALAGTFLSALIAAAPKNLERRLQPHQTKIVEILAKESAPVPWLAGYFAINPTTDAVKPLLRSLGKHETERATKAALLIALRACTGLDYGDDVRAWQQAFR